MARCCVVPLHRFDPCQGFCRGSRLAEAFPMAGPAKQAARLRQGAQEATHVARPQESEQQVDVAVVWRVERNRVLDRRDHRGRHRDDCKRRMRYRETVASRGRPETLAAKKRVQDLSLWPPCLAAEPERDRLERGTLFPRRHAQQEIVFLEEFGELHDSLGAMPRPRGSRRVVGRPSSATGTMIESMHHGQRDAALGRDRLQDRQTCFVRNILMSRSIVQRGGGAEMNRIVGSAGAGRYMRD
jgi:hypothetical protein